MKEKVVNINDFKKEEKKRERKEKFQRTICDGLLWVDRNKEIISLAIPAAVVTVKGGTKIVSGISRNIRLHQEKVDKERRIYDRSLGKHIYLKRSLTNADMRTILERKEDGEKLSSILMDMNLIK